ncbi:hypothetical protein BOV88_03800 [Solemya velum gill symbiont]|uniref:Lipoprotein n=1 Tax=Solemya velum gill symbiont TaxID=2340 RepID=A0A1T2CLR7_SOVGS|nr:hypothetical protein [Solemya velum gill symbiont]OOY35770.1 hypothetical protein BOV88_03800 [Solemya velum gill symbiont]
MKNRLRLALFTCCILSTLYLSGCDVVNSILADDVYLECSGDVLEDGRVVKPEARVVARIELFSPLVLWSGDMGGSVSISGDMTERYTITKSEEFLYFKDFNGKSTGIRGQYNAYTNEISFTGKRKEFVGKCD